MSIAEGEAIWAEVYGHLKSKNITVAEGGSSPPVLSYLIELCQKKGAINIGEIGFNAGLSSFAFFSASPDIKVTSFDLGRYPCVSVSKRYIDGKFPKRHTLLLGDSRTAVPKYKKDHPDACFDLVFVDGGHSYEIARADLLNLKPLCNEKTAVVMDDLTPWQFWGVGPMRAWAAVLHERIVIQDALKDGLPVSEIKLPGMRGWALGRYRYDKP